MGVNEPAATIRGTPPVNRPATVATEPIPSDAAKFLRQVNEMDNPVARALLEEWSIFVFWIETNAEPDTTAATGSSTAAATRPAFFGRPKDVWAMIGPDTAATLSHESVDQTGQLAIAFFAWDVRRRSWSAELAYQVVGHPDRGELQVHVKLFLAGRPPLMFDFVVRYLYQSER